MGRTGETVSGGRRTASLQIRAIVTCFIILAGSTTFGVMLGMGGALFAFAIAEGDGRGGLFVVAGFLMMAGAGIGLVAGAAYSAWWLSRRIVAIQTGKPDRS